MKDFHCPARAAMEIHACKQVGNMMKFVRTKINKKAQEMLWMIIPAVVLIMAIAFHPQIAGQQIMAAFGLAVQIAMVAVLYKIWEIMVEISVQMRGVYAALCRSEFNTACLGGQL